MQYTPKHKRFATTLPYFSEPGFAARASYLWPSYHSSKMGELGFDIRNVISILAAALKQKLLVIDSTPRSSLAACCLLALIPRRLHGQIILHGEMYAPSRGILNKLEQVAMRCADHAVDRYIVISSDELKSFPQTWGVSDKKMSFLPFFWTLNENEARLEPIHGDYIFAGGNSFRDYEPLIEAARRLRSVKFVIATHRLANHPNLPPNVMAQPLSHAEFMESMRKAKAVVVPIESGVNRSAGQQTYLNAMLYGKPAIVTKACGVNDYIVNGENGWIVDGTEEEYFRLLDYIVAPENSENLRKLSDNARQTALKFTFDRHVRGIVEIVDEFFPEKVHPTVSAGVTSPSMG